MTRIARYFIFLALLVPLMACETPVERGAFPDITFAHLPAIALDVAEIRIVKVYVPPLKRPHVDHEFPVPPLRAAERWVKDRLKAVGQDGVATVTIHDAGVTESRLGRMGGIKGTFTTEQSERYDAAVEVAIEVRGGKGLRVASATARTERNRTVPEDISLADREKVWFALTENLMREFDRAFEAQIKRHLGAFLR